MIPRWAYFLTAIMFSINLLFIGFGLIDINSSPLSNKNMNTLDTPIEDYSGSSNLDTKTTMDTDTEVSDESTGEVQFGISEIVNMVSSFISLILNLLFGYTVIFWMLNMPPILVYLFSTIIGLSMTMVVIDILIATVSTIRRLIP